MIKTRKFKVHGLTKIEKGKRTYAEGYFRWRSMWARCESPSSVEYVRYGARGISVCDEWRDFWVFQKWLLKNQQPGRTMDRLDNNGEYSPENVGWATPLEQQLNSRITPARLKGMKKAQVASKARLHGIHGDPLTRRSKICSRCKKRKKIKFFRKRSDRPDQVAYCLNCQKEYSRERAKVYRNRKNS
jgi:hypothetical protein